VLGRGRPFAFSPGRWPVRWRLAGVSAGLTFVILLTFAAVVGRLAQERLESDFRSETQATARQAALAFSVDQVGALSLADEAEEALERTLLADVDSALRVVNGSGEPLAVSPNAPEFPPPRPGLQRFGDLQVATEQISSTSLEDPRVFVQYARSHHELDATINRLWLFLAIGVAGGAILATMAGLWIARRAMGPVAALTATARQIATTRDPSLAMPKPEADDEVAELARTLDSMLSELDAARAESQLMVQAQREFIADASHELRTPLTSILANLELLHERVEGDAREGGEESEMVDSALRSSRRMRRLVGDLLMLARADAGRVGERRVCDLSEIAHAAIAEIRPVAGDHDLEVDAPSPAPVMGSADELHRLAVNLLDNGVRHTPAGTTIRLAVVARDEQAVLQVDDDGPGLPDGAAETVFSRFVRGGGPADLAASSGTGLGLAIVRAVAESHGGDVRAERSPEGGARFTVTLPAAEQARDKSKVSANV